MGVTKNMKPIKLNRKPKTEREIKKEIADYFTMKGWLVVQVRNTGTFNKKSGGYIPAHQLGVSDLICLTSEGKWVAIEVKRPGGVLSNWQAMFLDDVRERKGAAWVCYSLDDAIALEAKDFA